MSALGQKQTYAMQKAMSALPPKATLIAPTENPVDSPRSHRSFRIFDFQPRLCWSGLYGAPSFFETMPSKPKLANGFEHFSPSLSVCSTY
jgi:hypothetical protein